MTKAPKLLSNLLVVASWAFLAGCQSVDVHKPFRDGDYAAVLSELDGKLDGKRLNSEFPVSPENFQWTTLADLDDGLNRGYAELVVGHPRVAVRWLEQGRVQLNERLAGTSRIGEDVTTIIDERTKFYAGRFHEHVIAPALLGLVDAATGGVDAFAYASMAINADRQIRGLQVNPIADNPQACYASNGFATYATAVLLESTGSADTDLMYKKAGEALASDKHTLVQAGLDRAPLRGLGTVHIFDFAGVAPPIVQAKAEADEAAVAVAATAVAALLTDSPGALTSNVTRLPVTSVGDASPTSNPRTTLSGQPAELHEIMNSQEVLRAYTEATRPAEIARGIVRRTVKGWAGSQAGSVSGSILGLFTGAIEGADTRSWSLLPSSIRAARLTRPQGDHTLTVLGASHSVPVNSAGTTLVLIFRPSESMPPRIYVGTVN